MQQEIVDDTEGGRGFPDSLRFFQGGKAISLYDSARSIDPDVLTGRSNLNIGSRSADRVSGNDFDSCVFIRENEDLNAGLDKHETDTYNVN